MLTIFSLVLAVVLLVILLGFIAAQFSRTFSIFDWWALEAVGKCLALVITALFQALNDN